MAEGWMGWQSGRTIMADLQDTNAATEEIYGPLLIVDCPVSDEMISQKLRTAGSSECKKRERERALSLVPAHYLLIRCFGCKPLQEVHPGNNRLAVNMTQTGENKCERESETVKVNQGHGESGSLRPRVKTLSRCCYEIHVICKTFEEAIAVNSLEGLHCLNAHVKQKKRIFTWNHIINTCSL